MSRIGAAFEALRGKGEKALITYLTAGDPDLATTARLVRAMAGAGADVVELGVPFSDPIADGPVIQKASERALRGGVTVRKVLELVAGLRRETAVPLALLTYYNPVYRYGPAAFVRNAAASGVDGLIVPDLPWEEAGELRELAAGAAVDLIPLLAPTSTPERIRRAMATGRGFVYCISLTGVTGDRDRLADGLEGFIRLVRDEGSLPVAVGFGIGGPEQARQAAALADGVIVGSAIVRLVEKHAGSPALEEEVSCFVRELKRAVRGD